MTNALIADISTYQDSPIIPGHINFARMRAGGVSGVIVRAGQNSWKDDDFILNYSAAKTAGIPRGVYWYYDSRTPPGVQAALCMSLLGIDYPELGVWGDFEERYGGQWQGWQNWKVFLQVLRSKINRVGIYTGPFYWMSNRPTTKADLDFFGTFPLWLAHYGVLTPAVPSPWKSWLFWQYTSSGDGARYGVESKEIDLSWFNGDETAFRNYFSLTETLPPSEGGITPPPVTPTGGSTMPIYKGVCTYDGAKVWGRIGGTQTDTLHKGEAITCDLKTFSGATEYIRLTSHGNGWTKLQWVSVTEQMVQPPVTTPPDTNPVDNNPEYILAHWKNGVEKKYIPE